MYARSWTVFLSTCNKISGKLGAELMPNEVEHLGGAVWRWFGARGGGGLEAVWRCFGGDVQVVAARGGGGLEVVRSIVNRLYKFQPLV